MPSIHPFITINQVKSLDLIFDEDDKKRGDTEKGLLSRTGCLFYDHVQTYLQLNTSKAFQRCVAWRACM
jgi:hypothetical protein